MELFSKRNRSLPDVYRYDIPEHVRCRLLHTFRENLALARVRSYDDVLKSVEKQALMAYGVLKRRKDYFFGGPAAIEEHYFACSDEEVMDFYQLCFATTGFCPWTLVAVNKVLAEENVGYELTPFREEKLPEEVLPPGTPRYGFGASVIMHPPTVIKKDEKVLHSEVVKPCLHVLGNAMFKTANDELLKAFAEYRKGEYADVITDAGAAFESVMKVIFTQKKWPYDPQKDACKALVDICISNNLVYPFYAPILQGIGTIRNKLGDAHGKGPNPDYVATKEHADHMLYTVCATINLLVPSANL